MKFTLENSTDNPDAVLLAESVEASLSRVTCIGEATGICLIIDPYDLGRDPIDPPLNVQPSFRFTVEIFDQRSQGCLIPAIGHDNFDGFIYHQKHSGRIAATIERKRRLESVLNETMPAFLTRLAEFIAGILKEGQTVQDGAAA